MPERSIVEAAARLRRTGEPHLVATLVEGVGAQRRPGARMLLTRFRWIAGTATGGVLASARDAWERTAAGPILLTYTGQTSDEDLRSAFGLPGDGAVDVLVERAGATGRPVYGPTGSGRPVYGPTGSGRIDALEVAARCFHQQRRGAVATVFRSDIPELPIGARLARIAGQALEQDRLGFDPHVRELVAADLRSAIASGESGCRRYDTPFGTVDVFLEAILPPPRLFLFGTGHDALPVTQLARSLGWDVVVCAPDERHAARDRFATADEYLVGTPEQLASRVAGADRAVAIVMHRDLDRDRACVTALLATPVRHIAVLGSAALLREVIDPRVRAPRGPGMSEEIAFAIVGDALATLDRVTHVPVPHGGGSATTIAAAPAR